jgi:hypothetical protein
MSALQLRHRLAALDVEAELMLAGDQWDIRVPLPDDRARHEVTAAIRRWQEERRRSTALPGV